MAPVKYGAIGIKSCEYHSWANMKQRCLNPNRPDFKYYGGRGIKVCPRWMEFGNFLADMGPSNGLTLERKDVNGNYEPGNCVWATWTEQQNNHRPIVACRRGHPLTAENTYRHKKSGKRLCKACHRCRGLEWRRTHRGLVQ